MGITRKSWKVCIVGLGLFEEPTEWNTDCCLLLVFMLDCCLFGRKTVISNP